MTTSTLTAPALATADVEAELAEIVDSLTRRGLLGVGAGVATLAGLAACGQAPATGPSSSASRTVTTVDGRFTVPAHPEHVVCIDYFTAIFLIELGLIPAGGIDYSWVDPSTMYPRYVPILKKLPDIGQITATNFEKVAALHPDLILGPTPGSRYDNSKGAMAELGAVAPVASVDFGQTGDWRGPFRQTAELVGRMDRFRPLVASYQATVAKARQSHADLLANTVVSVVDYSQNGTFALDLSKSTDGLVLADLGVRFGRASAPNSTGTRELSVERLSELADSDVILYRADATGAPTSGLQDLVKLQSWKDLPAVRAGHAYPIGWADVCTYRWAEAAIADFVSLLDRYAAA